MLSSRYIIDASHRTSLVVISCLEAPALSRAGLWYVTLEVCSLAAYPETQVLQLIHRPATAAAPTTNGNAGRFACVTVPF